MNIKIKYLLLAAPLFGGLAGITPQACAQGGVPLWTNRYDGPAHGYDAATSVAVDGSGNVFVMGICQKSGDFARDYATIAYSSAGVALWTNRQDGTDSSPGAASAMSVDSSGKVIVTGFLRSGTAVGHFATIAYSDGGVPLWTNHAWSVDIDASEVAMAVDNSGHVIVTGDFWNGGSLDYMTVAYSGAGVALWTNRYGRLEGGTDLARAVAVDNSGNVIVTGCSQALGEFYSLDYSTIAYSSVSVPLWTNHYNGPDNSDDFAIAAAVDGSGNVFVTGSSWSETTDEDDYATIAYSSVGVPLWTNRYNGPGNGTDEPCGVAVDSSGNVFVAGSSTGNGSGLDYATIKYSNAGVPLWTNRYNGSGNGNDEARAVAVDSNGNVFVTGQSVGSGGALDCATVAYSGSGLPLWTNRYNGGEATALAVDSSGNVFVTGTAAGDYVTIKYSAIPASVRLSIEADGIGGYLLRFKGSPGSAYRLQRATSLTGPWTTSAPQTAPASGLVEFQDLFPAPDWAFYRARAE